MFSNGEEEGVKKAKSIIKYAIVGLILIFFAWSITTFILGDKSTKTPGLINAPVSWTTPLEQITSIFTPTSAYAAEDTRGFGVYRDRINAVVQLIERDLEVDGKVKTVNLSELESAVK